MSKNNILFVFEGEKTEPQISNNLNKHFLKENVMIHSSFCADIYQLYEEILKDRDLDSFQLLKEIPQNKEKLSNFKRSDFAEIYMFFDYDGHATMANDEKISELLNFFNEETDAGKLYISYPMVEALKHINSSIDFKELKVIAKENINYKQIVDSEADNKFKQVNKFDFNTWLDFINFHLKKMNYIVNLSYTFPLKLVNQNEIFNNQLKKYINIDSTVAVLGSFPIFLFDYYGYTNLNKILTKNS